MNYFKKHLGDYAKKTGHLSPLEHGVYGLIMDAYYDREQGPTLIEATRYARARTEEEKSAVLAVLDEFFTLGDDGRHVQNRIEEELATYRAQAEVNRGIAVAREQKKRERLANDPSTVRDPIVQGQEQVREPSQKPIANSHKPDSKSVSDPAGPDAALDEPVDAVVEKAKKRRAFTDEDMAAACWLESRVLAVNAAAKKPNLEMWADEVRLMRDIDGRTHREICELFEWAKRDSFWCANIQSPSKLREKWDQLTETRARPARGGSTQGGKFRVADVDHSSSAAAMAESMARHSNGVPDDDNLSFND